MFLTRVFDSALSPCSSASEESKTSKSNEKRLSTGSRPNTDLVKWQQGSLKTPLLRLPPDLAALALECFDCILRYCGDLMVDTDLTEVKCVYTILMVSIKANTRSRVDRPPLVMMSVPCLIKMKTQERPTELSLKPYPVLLPASERMPKTNQALVSLSP